MAGPFPFLPTPLVQLELLERIEGDCSRNGDFVVDAARALPGHCRDLNNDAKRLAKALLKVSGRVLAIVVVIVVPFFSWLGPLFVFEARRQSRLMAKAEQDAKDRLNQRFHSRARKLQPVDVARQATSDQQQER